MKNLFFALIAFTVVVLSACNNNDNQQPLVAHANVVEKPTEIPKIEIVHKILSPEEEQQLLEKIPTITNPEDAYKIYLDNDAGSKVEQAAKVKWEQLMLTKISTITNLDALYRIYLDNDCGSKVEQAAKIRYKKLGGQKI